MGAEIRRRLEQGVFSVDKDLAAFMAEDIVAGNRPKLSKKIFPSFTANKDPLAGSTLLCVIIYNRMCEMPIGNLTAEILF